jgi:hypothetical protein
VGANRTFTPGQRVAFLIACVAGFGSVLPILLDQYNNYIGGAIFGSINWTNLVSVVGTPFAPRVGTPVDARTVAGALVVLGAVLVLMFSRGRETRYRYLLATLGAFGVIALIGVDLTGQHILITRYTTITAPFLLTAVVAACMRLPRIGAAALGAAAVAVAVAGLIDNHSTRQFYAPAREAVDYIAPRERPGDFMLAPGVPLTDTPLFYYVTRRTHPKLHLFGLHDPGLADAFRINKRIWIVDEPRSETDASAVAAVRGILDRYRWRVVSARVFETSIDLGVLLTVPDVRRHRAV